MSIDRAVQRQILEALRTSYPDSVRFNNLHLGFTSKGDKRWVTNAAYLAEHGLIEAKITTFMSGEPSVIALAKLTAKGLDFLEDDGGLSAILGVVTVRLHDDTIKALIEKRIQEADLPPADKQRYLDRLRSLPADATRHLVLELMERGLDNWQVAWQSLQILLGRA